MAPLYSELVRRARRLLPSLAAATLGAVAASSAEGAVLMLSGNESKIELTSGAAKVVPPAQPDSLTLLDFAEFPPKVSHVEGVANSVIGPPSNIAISPDGSLALVANSLKLDASSPTKWAPISEIHVVDLRVRPPKVVQAVTAGRQPSGMSISRDGRFALVANRADGTVTRLWIDGMRVRTGETVKVCAPEESISDVAIAPDGRSALASVQKGGYLAMLRIEPSAVTFTGRKVSTYGQPYRVLITPDGALGLTAGQGAGNGLDRDAVTVVDLRANPVRATDYVAVGAVPESIELSPDGRLLAAVVMNGSNLGPTDPNRSLHGVVVLMERHGATYRVVEEQRIGRIPEGVAFTSDGRHLVVQCHPDRELWVFAVKRGRLRDTGHRIAVPGMPASLRASP